MEKTKVFGKNWIQTYMLIFIVIGLGVIMSFVSPNFLTVTNLMNFSQYTVSGRRNRTAKKDLPDNKDTYAPTHRPLSFCIRLLLCAADP